MTVRRRRAQAASLTRRARPDAYVPKRGPLLGTRPEHTLATSSDA